MRPNIKREGIAGDAKLFDQDRRRQRRDEVADEAPGDKDGLYLRGFAFAPERQRICLAEECGDSLRPVDARIEDERGYGYRLVEDYSLPQQTFDRAEIEAIALGLAELKAMGDPVLSKAAETVLAKVAVTLSDDRERYFLHAVSGIPMTGLASHSALPGSWLPVS
jgi:hypothetical protein